VARKQVIMRVSALSLVGGALLIYGSETGQIPVLSGSLGGGTPGAEVIEARLGPVPSAGREWQIPDAFAKTQGVAQPAGQDPDAAPISLPRLAAVPDRPLRPAAFIPPPALGDPAQDSQSDEAALSPFGLPCGLDVTVTAIDRATIALDVAAPCHPDTPLSLRHAGLTLGGRTDAVGLLTLDIPAFESPASVTVRLADGAEAVASVEIPDLAAYDRVALAWRGDLGLELHAAEAGVAPGEGAGPVVALGSAGGMWQVFTRPREGAATAEVAISIDAPITTGTCTRRAEASILRVEAAGPATVTPLGFTYPDCDAVGDTLVLQNALRDLRLAVN
jgi:hypothetical protein